MRKNYNLQRPKLLLPEYGRHIQTMVDELSLIENRDERNRQAKAVIAVMGNVNPLLRDTADFTHKLWDHLFIMSDFKLDVDSPYERPTRETVDVKPERVEYSQRRILYKHYGKYVSNILQSIPPSLPAEQIASTVDNVARYMRAKSFEFNEEHPNNEAIIKDIKIMSKGAIHIDEEAINNIKSDYKQHLSSQPHKRQQARSGQKGQQNSKGGQKSRGQFTSRPFAKSATKRVTQKN
ncbi:MAG: DUF4290 domain-containing protein [Rikenellaceae bacterium]